MPSERRRPARSAAFRGALWITLIALIATGAALTLQFVQTVRVIETRQHALVDDEMTSLVERYRSGGIAALAGAIEREQQLPRINEFFYLLANPDGTPIVGNLVAWPAEVGSAGYHSFTTQVQSTRAAPRQRRVEARAVLLGGGFRLLVGSLSDEPAALRQRYVATLFWSFLVTGVLGLLFGYWYSRRGLNFLDAAARTGQRFLAGRLDERLPVSGQGDEYDRLAETLNRSFEEVERLVGSLRAATDGLGHDLKTPLTRIMARMELAEIERASPEMLRDILADSRHDLDLLLRLIEDVLALARAEETAIASFAPVQLDALVSEALELFQPVAEDKDLRLTSEIEAVTLHGARSLLAQAVTNLLDNALKYTPAGGSVHVALARDAQAVRLSVIDSGPGIPAALRERALTRFARLDASRSESGSGIGLSVVAAAARVHRAELRLSDASPGLRVDLIFPDAGA